MSERVLGHLNLQGKFFIYIYFFSCNYHRDEANVISFLFLSAVVIEECHFKSGYCGWTSLGDNEENWKLSNNKTFVKFPGKWKIYSNTSPPGWVVEVT